MAVKFHRQVFEVEGCGRVPYDMLRYDRCWPADEPTAHRIEKARADNTVRRFRLIRYVADDTHEPCVPRWAGFGWKIVAGSIHTERFPV